MKSKYFLLQFRVISFNRKDEEKLIIKIIILFIKIMK